MWTFEPMSPRHRGGHKLNLWNTSKLTDKINYRTEAEV